MAFPNIQPPQVEPCHTASPRPYASLTKLVHAHGEAPSIAAHVCCNPWADSLSHWGWFLKHLDHKVVSILLRVLALCAY